MSEPISMLELRRVEAAILRDVYDVVAERGGEIEAAEVVRQAVLRSAISQGKAMADEKEGEPDLADFAALIPRWEVDGALEVEILHKSPERLEFDVRRCRYAEMYAEMGLANIGHLLSCNRDAAFCIGYNPKMKLTRTRTIMDGADHCDFRYRLQPVFDE
jgi:L-2-amino-thiazoline-4-carboxylic acid hydrolase-like protein